MKQRILISLIFFSTMNVFSQSILIQKKSDAIVVKRGKITLLPVKIYIPANQAFYNFSNYAELNSDNESILNKVLDGLIYQLYDSTYITQWGKGMHVLNLKCLTSDTDSLRLRYDTRKNQVVEYNTFVKFSENRLYSYQTDRCINTNIYYKTPDIKGDFKLYFIYGQNRLGMKLADKDLLIKNKDTSVFEGLIFSDTIDIKIE
ncbi:MAG: hypothetical protein H6538_03760 [Bacteroidales bacterium]|nr:hypothetical protein [Bacteroidales bacterium]